MKLIIVESPTKARTLTRFLGDKEYRVQATMGHIRDLPKSALGVDIDHDFTPTYIVPKDRQKSVTELKDIANKAESIILATDPDREGEAIAWHVSEIVRQKDRKSGKKRNKMISSSTSTSKASLPILPPLQRIAFHEITETAIKEALLHPKEIDHKLVDAQQARRVLDRLVGYKLSPLLWQKLSRRWLSAGRVQSVTVRLVVEREREIEKFAKEEFWTIDGLFISTNSKLTNNEITAQLVRKGNSKYEKVIKLQLFDGEYTTTSSSIDNKQKVESIINDLKSPFIVSAVDRKEIRRVPPPPYTTSTLQQDAGRRLGFSSKKTMQLAQKLYEEGIITYHRTDSVNLAEKFIEDSRAFISSTYGKTYIPVNPRRFQTKSKLAQEAHEAIRPTDAGRTSEQFTQATQEINHDHIRLYDLIWKRALACQAKEAVFDSTTITITSENGYVFQCQGSIITFDGFLKILGRENNNEIELPHVTVGETIPLENATPVQHFTVPPPRYSEAALVKALEEEGIGRPSTYAPIISTIQDRQYVTKEDLPGGRQGKKLLPTDLGFTVTDFLVKYFPAIMELPFTAIMENELDAIAAGEKEWVPVVKAYYEPFSLLLDSTYATAEKVQMPVELLEELCPKCKHPLLIRTGRYGKFISCGNFPTCKYSRQLVEKIGRQCPRCGGDMVIKKSHRGKTFYGCSNYPTCSFAAWKKEDIK